MAKLVIVESPAKAKTIGKYLGKDYKVTASMGHIRDLPASQLGIDVENGYTPRYITIKGKEKLVRELKDEAKHADGVLLATDPDREGEAISWHLANVLGLDPSQPNRVTFDEITKKGVQEGMAHPRAIDMDLFNAQQARRELDRLVGYKLSPFLWRKVRRGLSAGRVQSVAVRLIRDRELEIEKFVPDEYWNIDAEFGKGRTAFTARLSADAAGKKLAIVSTAGDSISVIFLNRSMDYFIYDTVDEVNAKAHELIEADRHDVIVVYNADYDAQMHRTGPESPEAMDRLRANIAVYSGLVDAVRDKWPHHNTLYGFMPDHGCHLIDGGCGSHGLDMDTDMNVIHFYGFSPRK